MRDSTIHNSGGRTIEVSSRTTVAYEPRYDAPSATLELFRIVRRGESQVEEAPVWSRSYAHRRHGVAVLEWLTKRPEQWPLWGRLTQLIGPDELLAAAAREVTQQRREAAIELLRRRAKARKSRKKARVVHSYLVERNGEFGIDLRRGGQDKGFFVIWFRQAWERERFRDWWRPQRGRFAEFIAFFEQHGAQSLERMLLKEMLETERRIRLAGLSAGGRRPLRFWRGDE